MSDAPRMAYSHMGLYVIEMAKMVDFYTRVLGFTISDQAQIRGLELVFLTRNPEEHHQIALVPGRDPCHPSTVNQIAFRVVSLPELRRIHAQIVKEPVSSINPVNHGGAWSIYFLDPEGNRIELFVQTPWYMPPVSVPLDLGQSDEEIYQLTETMVKRTTGHMTRAEWHEQLRQRMLKEGTVEQHGPA